MIFKWPIRLRIYLEPIAGGCYLWYSSSQQILFSAMALWEQMFAPIAFVFAEQHNMFSKR